MPHKNSAIIVGRIYLRVTYNIYILPTMAAWIWDFAYPEGCALC